MTAVDLTVEQHAEVGLAVDPIGPTKVEAARIQQRVSAARAKLAPAPVEGFLKTPDSMIDDIEWAKHHAGQIALTLKDASQLVREARRVWARHHAIALTSSAGKSSEQREAEALLACEDQQEALDVAEAAYEYAKGVARAIEQSLSATQTQASLVRAQMALAGTGREA